MERGPIPQSWAVSVPWMAYWGDLYPTVLCWCAGGQSGVRLSVGSEPSALFYSILIVMIRVCSRAGKVGIISKRRKTSIPEARSRSSKDTEVIQTTHVEFTKEIEV